MQRSVFLPAMAAVLLLAATAHSSHAMFELPNVFKQVHHGIQSLTKANAQMFDSMMGAALEDDGSRESIEDDSHSLGSQDFEGDSAIGGSDFIDFGSSGFPNIFNVFHHKAIQKPWWQGPNVCVNKEDIDESDHKNGTNDDDAFSFGSYHFSSCHQTDTKYVCTTRIRSNGIRKTFIVKYQCCSGFLRVGDKRECTEVHLKSLLETATDVGARDFVELLRTTGLVEQVEKSNVTLFAPTDDAIRDFSDSMQEANQVEFYIPGARAKREVVGGANMKNVVRSHIVPGIQDISDLVDEQVLYSDNNNSTVRINMYPVPGNRLVTVNCAKVTSMNNYAVNGIVHVIDRMISPVTKTLEQLILEDEQLSTFKEMLEKANMINRLGERGHLTIFAPSNAAFNKMDNAVKNRLLNTDTCLKSVMNHHVLSHSLCSCAINERVSTFSVGGGTLFLERSAEDKLFVAGSQVTARDIIATNGVLHIIDDVLLPDSGRSISGVLESHNMTTFLGLLKEAGLTESIDSMGNVTLFVPTEKALSSPEAVEILDNARKGNSDSLRDLLLFHTAGPSVSACELSNNMELKSGLADRSIRINLYTTIPFFSDTATRATAQCARFVKFDEKACGGVVHEVDRLLVPPTGSVLEALDSLGNFTILKKIIQETGLAAELKENTPFTLLAPDDQVFEQLQERDFKRLMDDKELAGKVIRQHILPEVLCCSGAGLSSWPFTSRVETLLGSTVPVRRDYEGRIHIGTTSVVKCDKTATDGVIHTVNRIMGTEHHHRRPPHRSVNPNLDVVLYGL